MFASRGKLFFALLLLITTVLSGCKNTTLQNGIAKTSLSGNAEATQTFKFTLPANTTALMIQSSANDQLQLQLQDANKAPISGCWSATFCSTGGLAAGTYHVQVSALGPYSGQSLVAAWSGPDAATLKNNQPVTGLTGKAGTVVLQSLHIPFYIGELNLQTTATGTYSLELLDTYGTVLHTCSDSQQCSISQTFNGDYFVRITGQSDFANLNILATWGGAQNATIQNGVTMSGIAGNANSERVESLYIEPGTLAFMLQKTRYDAPVFLEILDENGQLETYCSDICTINAPAPGRYYVRMLFAERVTDFSFVAVWAGENGGQLKNGVTVHDLRGDRDEALLTSMYIPENTHGLMVQASDMPGVYPELLDAYGNVVSYYGNVIDNPAPGVYFVRTRLFEDNVEFALTAAWAANEQGTLQNGVLLAGLSGNQDDVLLASLYIPENTHGLMVQASDMPGVYPELLDAYGNVVSYYGNVIDNPVPGVYYVRTRVFEDNVEFALTAAWATNGQGTLQNGVLLAGLSGNQNDVLLASIYIPENTHGLMVQTSDVPGVYPELLDAYGNAVGYYGNFIDNPIPGVYYVRTRVFEDNVEFALTAAWATNGEGTLQNGALLAGLSGNRDDVLLASIYIPENTHGLMVQTSDVPGVYPELLDAYGNAVGYYGNFIDNPIPGVYYVRTRVFEDNVEFGLAAAWATNGQGTLQNGALLAGLSGNRDDVLLASIYIPENTHGLMVQTSDVPGVYPELLDAYGNAVGYYGNFIDNPIPGVYYVRTRVFEDNVEFGLAAAWATNGQGTLQNGALLAGLSGNRDDVLLASIYIPENTHGLMVQTSDVPGVYPELLDAYGNAVGYYGNFIDNPVPGVYYVRTRVFEDNTEFSLTAAWASNQQGTLQNGIALTGLTGNQFDTLVSTLYLTEPTENLSLQTSAPGQVFLRLLDENGYEIPIQPTLPPGLYYVLSHVTFDNLVFDLTASW